jgi:hypothetical protein
MSNTLAITQMHKLRSIYIYTYIYAHIYTYYTYTYIYIKPIHIINTKYTYIHMLFHIHIYIHTYHKILSSASANFIIIFYYSRHHKIYVIKLNTSILLHTWLFYYYIHQETLLHTYIYTYTSHFLLLHTCIIYHGHAALLHIIIISILSLYITAGIARRKTAYIYIYTLQTSAKYYRLQTTSRCVITYTYIGILNKPHHNPHNTAIIGYYIHTYTSRYYYYYYYIHTYYTSLSAIIGWFHEGYYYILVITYYYYWLLHMPSILLLLCYIHIIVGYIFLLFSITSGIYAY